MGRGTLIVLAVLVGLLLLLRREQEEAIQEDGQVRAYDHALIDGMGVDRVRKLRVDNLERAYQLLFERDAQGLWYITDPVEYPAFAEVLGTLLDTLAKSRGILHPAGELEPLGLDPPLIVLEVELAEVDGVRTTRVEVGGLDADPRRIFVRVPGHPAAPAEEAVVLRVPRTLYTTLNRTSDDFRDNRMTNVRARDVIGMKRRGLMDLPDEGTVDLELDAVFENGAWNSTKKPRVQLDPVAVGLVARGVADMRVTSFVDDDPANLAYYGLDPPRFRVELDDARGRRHILLYGHTPAQAALPAAERRWLAMRQGYPHVWSVNYRDLLLIARPAYQLFDYSLVRLRRDDVARLELTTPSRTLACTRDGDGWQVQELLADAAGAVFPADPAVIEDVLARLEQAQVGGYPAGLSLAPAEVTGGFRVELHDGTSLAGNFGPFWSDPDGALSGVRFLRAGDDRAGLVAEEVAALAQTTLADLRSKRVVDLESWFVVDQIRMSRGAAERHFHRVERAWYVRGERSIPAPEVFELAIVDRLLQLQAVEWLPADPAPELEDPVRIEIEGSFGQPIALELGRDSAGQAVCALLPGRFARIAPDFLGKIEELFGE